MSAAQASLAPAVESVSPDNVKDRKPTCEHDKEVKGTSDNSSDVEGTALKPVPCDGIDKDDRAKFDYLLKHSNDGCSDLAWVRKVKKSERFLGIAKGRTFIKEMRGLYFPLSKGLIFSHGLQSKRPRSSKRRRLFKWRRLYKRQHSKDPNPIWEDGSEDSHYAEGTALHKPAPPDSVVPPKRRRSPSLQDSYTSLEDDNAEGISEDSSDAEDKSMPEVQNTTSEDGSDVEDGDFSDVEDPDAKDDEYSTNVEEDDEDSTNVGELEDSSDGEYSSDGTTLLKPVLYIDKLSEEDPKVKKTIEHLLQFSLAPWLLDCIDSVKLTGGDYGEDHYIAGPALQVFAVHISNPTLKELNIYGHISVTDDKYNTYYVYNRASESPEKVSPGHGFLPINSCFILPLISGNVEFRLKDCGDLIFERKVTVEYLSKYEDGHVRKLGIGGKDNCHATIFFTIIPYARFVEFRMYLSEPCPDLPGKVFQVHGRIKANDALCFKKVPEEPLAMYHGAYDNYIGEFVLAVSVFSPLLLDVELYGDGIKFADQVCEVVFYNFRFRELKFTCDDNKYKLGMTLQWIPYNDYFDSIKWGAAVCCQKNKPTDYPTLGFENEKSECDLPASIPKNKPTDYPTLGFENEKSECDLPASIPINKPPTYPTVVYEDEKSDYDLPASMPINLEPATVTSKDGPLVEVFSVLVGGGELSVPLALCGKILVRDGQGTFYIFSRNPDSPDKLYSSNKLHQSRTSLSLAWPRQCVVEEKLFMHFKLEDAYGRPVCIGHLNWYQRPPWYERPFDTRICAVIPGENGYFAAVHFSVFKNGLKAKVTVEYNSCRKKDGPDYSDDDPISVYGSVFVEYSNYKYPSRYENEYCRSVIFKRSKENAVKVKNGTKIPLSKSMVSAPSDCEGIIVDVDLLVLSSERSRFGCAFGRILFKGMKNGVCEMRDGDGGEGWRCAGCHVKVMVDWVHELSD